jgi:hypothetical protein
MVTAGPLCRYAQDLLPFLQVLLGNNISRLQLDAEVHSLYMFWVITSVWMLLYCLKVLKLLTIIWMNMNKIFYHFCSFVVSDLNLESAMFSSLTTG